MNPDIRDLTFFELEQELKKTGEPKFRAGQVFSWIHQKGVASFDEMKNLPKDLLRELSGRYSIRRPEKIKEQTSKDGTKKFLWRLFDGALIESVLLIDKDRKTVCLSTQAGCRMNCPLCRTARGKFERNLSAGEIASQVIEIEKEAGRVSNVVYMGMGEPLDNYDNVLKSARILNDPKGKNIGQRHITISTCGLIPEIKRLAGEGLQVRLAISLNAPSDEIRGELMPVSKKYPLEALMGAVKEYVKKSGRRVTFEYALIKGVNDSPKDAQMLAKLIRGIMANVNLIEFNPFEECDLAPSPVQDIKKFREVLESVGIEVSQRFKRGQDIDAACGQLKGRAK